MNSLSLGITLSFSLLMAVGCSCIETAASPTTSKSPSKSPSLTVDMNTTGLAKTTKVEIIPKEPYSSEEQVINLNGQPMHVRVIFDGKKIEMGDNDFMQPHLVIYPVQEYANLFPAAKKSEFNKGISNLKKMIATKSDAGLKEYPILPASDGAELLHAIPKPLAFKNGSGMSYVAVYGNGDGPYDANSFFYTFQGLSTDGKNYVALFWPVKAVGLPPKSEQKPTESYLAKLPRAKFTPSLELLDKMVSSISIGK